MTINKHSSESSDVEIDVIKGKILKLCRVVGEQFQLAMDSLNSGNATLFRRIRDINHQVDLLKIDIDQICSSLLGKCQNDVAVLKWTLTVLKITADLDGISNQAKLLVMRAEQLVKPGTVTQSHCPANIRHCANLVLVMINKTTEAFSRSDASLAAEVILQNKKIGEEYNFITCSLIDNMLKGPRSISMTLDILLIAKAIERIGDHTKSISEYIILTTTGDNVRYASNEETENKLLQILSGNTENSSNQQLIELEDFEVEN